MCHARHDLSPECGRPEFLQFAGHRVDRIHLPISDRLAVDLGKRQQVIALNVRSDKPGQIVSEFILSARGSLPLADPSRLP